MPAIDGPEKSLAHGLPSRTLHGLNGIMPELPEVETVMRGLKPVLEGQRIAALLGSANRDPEVFADADAFDVARDPNPHIASIGSA